MNKLIKLVGSPFNPDFEVIGDKVIKLHFPYSEKDVTVVINPNIEEYKAQDDQPGVDVRQVMITTSTDETTELLFGLNDESNEHKININNVPHKLKLLSIGKENLEGEDFPYFEFFVDEE